MPDIYSVWESQGWIPPQVVEEYAPDRTILNLSFEKKNNVDKKSAIKIGDKKSVKTQERIQRIMEYMNEGVEYRIEDVSDIAGLKASRTRQILNLLVEENVIEALGENRNRRYKKK